MAVGSSGANTFWTLLNHTNDVAGICPEPGSSASTADLTQEGFQAGFNAIDSSHFTPLGQASKPSGPSQSGGLGDGTGDGMAAGMSAVPAVD